jgi:hypothetical protein
MAKGKNPGNPEEERPEIDPAVRDVMQEHTRAVSGRGPSGSLLRVLSRNAAHSH